MLVSILTAMLFLIMDVILAIFYFIQVLVRYVGKGALFVYFLSVLLPFAILIEFGKFRKERKKFIKNALETCKFAADEHLL